MPAKKRLSAEDMGWAEAGIRMLREPEVWLADDLWNNASAEQRQRLHRFAADFACRIMNEEPSDVG